MDHIYDDHRSFVMGKSCLLECVVAGAQVMCAGRPQGGSTMGPSGHIIVVYCVGEMS